MTLYELHLRVLKLLLLEEGDTEVFISVQGEDTPFELVSFCSLGKHPYKKDTKVIWIA